MRRILQTLSIALLSVILSIPCMEAQSRNRENRESRSNRTERTSSSRSNNKNNTDNRRGNSSSHNTRPNTSNTTNRRPDIIPANGSGNNSRPNVGNGNNNRPGNNNSRPNVGNHPAPRPPMVTPPHRPYRPVMSRPHYRPMPPRGWRPSGRIPVIRGILGLTFGTAINLSLDYLLSSGYTVDGYTNDIVYLRNVSALNYVWTDAALYYGANGLDASSFYYSTPRYDLGRYNNVYNSLVATYGMPVSVNNTPGSIGATWFGGNNGYITLSFGSNTMDGGLRYLTTLTFGF